MSSVDESALVKGDSGVQVEGEGVEEVVEEVISEGVPVTGREVSISCEPAPTVQVEGGGEERGVVESAGTQTPSGIPEGSLEVAMETETQEKGVDNETPESFHVEQEGRGQPGPAPTEGEPEPFQETVIKFAEQYSISLASQRFKVPTSTVKKWMKLENVPVKPKFNSPGQGRKISYSKDTDLAIAEHVKTLLSQGEKVSVQYLCNHARQLVVLENPQFNASTGWAQRFLTRHGIDLGHQRSKREPSQKTEGKVSDTRGRPLSYSSGTDQTIAEFVRSRQEEGQMVTNSELRRFARDLILKENPNFTGSASWAQNFLLRHKLNLHSSLHDKDSPLPSLSVPSSSQLSASQSLMSSETSLSPAAEITPTSAAAVHSSVTMATMSEDYGQDSSVDDSMKAALTLLSGESMDTALLNQVQVAALQTTLNELSSDHISLVELLNSAQQLQDHGSSEASVALISSSLDSSAASSALYLGLPTSEAFVTGLTGAAATQVNPNTQAPEVFPPSQSQTGRPESESGQASRPLSYTKETDQALANWVQEQQAAGKKVTFASLRAYAKRLVSSENPNFNASVGWVTPFLLRHNLDLSVNKKKKQPRKPSTPRKIEPSGAEMDDVELEGIIDVTAGVSEPMNLAGISDPMNLAGVSDPVNLAGVPEPMDSSTASEVVDIGHPPISIVGAISPQQVIVDVATTMAAVQLVASQLQAASEQLSGSNTHTQNLEGNPPQVEAGNQTVPAVDHSHTTPQPSDTQPTPDKKFTPPSSKKSLSKSQRRRHPLSEKLEVIKLMKEHSLAAHYVCRMLGVANSTLAGWIKLVQQKGPELEILSTNKKRANVSGQGRPLSYSKEKDEAIARWVKSRQDLGTQVTPGDLAKYATSVIGEENSSFTASSGWQQKFLQRHTLQLTPKSGEKSPVVEDQRAVPAAVTTEEVVTHEFSTNIFEKPYTDELDEQLARWVREKVQETGSLYIQALCQKAEEIIVKHNPVFVATLGWAFKFLHRNSLLLDPKPSMAIVDSPLATPSRKRLSDGHAGAVKKLCPTRPEDVTVSPSTGNLCEALLALSSQAQENTGSEGATPDQVQAAMQAVQSAVAAMQQQQQQQQTGTESRSQATSSSAVDSGGGGGGQSSTYFGKPAREFSSEEKEEVVRYANATTLQKAALKYGVAAPTVWRWRVELKLHQPKYTNMQKKYIIKFAETNSLKEASQRYGITGKTIQNWRKALQAEGELPMGGSMEDTIGSSPPELQGEGLVDPSGGPGGSTGSREVPSSEVVTYDGQNFQFIVDGGEVMDSNGGREGEGAGPRVDPVPLEVTSEVDIENVGMEYDVISSEGHAAKPRCTLQEKKRILQFALENSIKEASQKFGVSQGTLYYWKKSLAAGTLEKRSSGQAVGTLSLSAPSSSASEVNVQFAGLSGEASVMQALNPATTAEGIIAEHFIASSMSAATAAENVQMLSQTLAAMGPEVLQNLPADINLLQAVSSLSSLLASAEGELEATRKQTASQQGDSSSGGISSPTEVLVQPSFRSPPPASPTHPVVSTEEVAVSDDTEVTMTTSEEQLISAEVQPVSDELDQPAIAESVEIGTSLTSSSADDNSQAVSQSGDTPATEGETPAQSNT